MTLINGMARLTTPALKAGKNVVIRKYSGATNFNAASAKPLLQVVR
jgi:hypothetical protein